MPLTPADRRRSRSNARVWSPSATIVVATALTALACLLTLLYLDRESFGHDEGASLVVARMDWSSLSRVLVEREANMSLYYALLHYWLSVSNSEAGVRVLSVVPAVLAVPTFYALGRKLLGEPCAAVATLFLTLNGFFVYYAQDARSYSLLVFLVILSSLCFVAAVERQAPSWRLWIAYVLTASLSVYAHVFALFVIAAHALALGIFWRRFPGTWRAGLAALMATGALASPIVLFALTSHAGQLDWVRRPGAGDVVREVAQLAGRSRPLALAYLLAILWALDSLRRRWSAGSGHAFHDLLIVGWLLIPIVGSLILSIKSPVFISRYLIVALPPMTLLAASGVIHVGWRLPSFVFGMIIIGLSFRSVVSRYDAIDKEDWRSASAYLATRALPTDGILVYTMPSRAPLDVYVVKNHLAGRMPQPLFPPSAWGAFSLLGVRTPSIPQLRTLLPKHQRVWLILSHDEIDDRRSRSAAALRALLADRALLESQTFGAPSSLIKVHLYGEPARSRR